MLKYVSCKKKIKRSRLNLPAKYIYIILTYVAVQLSAFLVIPFRLYTNVDPLTLMVGWNIGSFVLALIISCYLLRDEINSFFQSRDKRIGQIVLWTILGFFLVLIAQVASTVIERFVFGAPVGSENTMQLMQVARQAPIFIILISILGPILEELVFRKAIFGSLYKKMNFFFAGIISGVLFAVLHNDFSHLLTYIAVAFVLAFIYVETKRILVPILAHMAMNTFAVIGQLSLDPEEMEQMLEQVQFILVGGF